MKSKEELAKEKIIERFDICYEDRVIPDFTEDKFHEIFEESFKMGFKEALKQIEELYNPNETGTEGFFHNVMSYIEKQLKD